jgi:hypothetical protein
MSITVEFGSKAAADQYRDDYEEYICPVDDERQPKTVVFVSDRSDWLLNQAPSTPRRSAPNKPRGTRPARFQVVTDRLSAHRPAPPLQLAQTGRRIPPRRGRDETDPQVGQHRLIDDTLTPSGQAASRPSCEIERPQ